MTDCRIVCETCLSLFHPKDKRSHIWQGASRRTRKALCPACWAGMQRTDEMFFEDWKKAGFYANDFQWQSERSMGPTLFERVAGLFRNLPDLLKGKP